MKKKNFSRYQNVMHFCNTLFFELLIRFGIQVISAPTMIVMAVAEIHTEILQWIIEVVNEIKIGSCQP